VDSQESSDLSRMEEPYLVHAGANVPPASTNKSPRENGFRY
jgi:hypothetical protein